MIYAEDILNKRKQERFKMTDVSKGTATGALIGLTAGILYAYFQQKKYAPAMIIGTLSGALISRLSLINNKI